MKFSKFYVHAVISYRLEKNLEGGSTVWLMVIPYEQMLALWACMIMNILDGI